MLGLARLDAEPGSPLAGQLVNAQEQVTLAVDELRELSRGVHPKALTDHGLAAAVENLATRSVLPVTADIRLPRRVPVSVETTAYFVIAEALANTTKHSHATQARVFVDAVTHVAAGATVVDPEVVRQLLNRRHDPLRRLTPREREVLALMAEGHANAEIARELYVTEAAVNKHVSGILQKLELRLDGQGHRRVLAVLTYLRA
ncbi:LuxR C-terminal-related transcriptional regulator [Streptomyces scopuliridis]|uniref:LuxR C-terminal-related transcriptional regulator n=1 Tax=Streptomyces scopuliridis TaxID=452529 RepID=UPI0036CF44A8